MSRLSNPVRRRRRVAVDAALVFIIILLMTQMWLLTATLESYLAGHTGPVLPGMIISGVLLAVSVALYRLVTRLDRLPERAPEVRRAGPWEIG
jgi:hypothetical protein